MISGPYDLLGAGDNSEDPNGLTVDLFTGRVWVSEISFPQDILEINSSDGTVLNQIGIGGVALLPWHLILPL